ncbi:hypothetical protein [Staphylococcus epidermidis]|uniref:hypothetical protein n=1 Tax=Staphylococcus epidermidis TaxID=1282 RepID=UPI001642BD87|nr:hypothetical protein [Staphylococcus epidermidis]
MVWVLRDRVYMGVVLCSGEWDWRNCVGIGEVCESGKVEERLGSGRDGDKVKEDVIG